MYHDFGHGCNRKWITCRVQNLAQWQILLYSCTGSLRLCRVVTDIMRHEGSWTKVGFISMGSSVGVSDVSVEKTTWPTLTMFLTW
jgi:hypothetical protein